MWEEVVVVWWRHYPGICLKALRKPTKPRKQIRISNRSTIMINRQLSSRINYELSDGHFDLINSMEQLMISQLLKTPPVVCGS